MSRAALSGIATGVLFVASMACSLGQSQELSRRDGRLLARPGRVTKPAGSGLTSLAIGRDRDGLLYVPEAAKSGPIPLVVLLHGAGGSAQGIHRRIFGGADSAIPVSAVEQFEAALSQAGVQHEIVTYPGAPHSFFDRHYIQHADASADAWQRILTFIRANTPS